MALANVRSSDQLTVWLRTWPKTETVGDRGCMFVMACCWPETKAACALALALAFVVQLEVAMSSTKKHPRSFCMKRFNLDSFRFATLRWAGESAFQRPGLVDCCGTLMNMAITPRGPKGSFLLGNLAEFGRDPLNFLTRCVRDYGDFVPLRF